MTLMCCTDDVILGIGIGYWYRCRPIVLGMLRGIVLTLVRKVTHGPQKKLLHFVDNLGHIILRLQVGLGLWFVGVLPRCAREDVTQHLFNAASSALVGYATY